MTRKPAIAALLAASLSAPAAAQHYDSSATPTTAYPTLQQQVPAVPQAYALGAHSGTDPYPYFCLPGYNDARGFMSLLDPGQTPASCTFKSSVKRQDCDCGYYMYRDQHVVYFPGYGTSDGQSDRVDYGCKPFSYGTATNCDSYGRCYSYSYPYCPAG